MLNVSLDLRASALATVPFFAVTASVGAQQFGDRLDPEDSRQASFDVEVVATGFEQPYALAFLPDGRLLVADRPGATLTIVDPRGGAAVPVEGLPRIYVEEGSDGGLHDVAVHPDFATNGLLYLDYAHETADGITLALARARLEGHRLVDAEQLFVVEPSVPDNTAHLGSRIVIDGGYVFLTMGDRYDLMYDAQDPTNHNGTVIRLHEDGRVPDDNPYRGVPGARPEIWSIGHRNAQGLAFHPSTGDLWLNEHGPKGGDEVNVIHPGRNYGWPIITYGTYYDGEGGGPIGEGITERAGMEQPVYYYRPSIGPSDMLFYTGDAFPRWRGDLFIGGMALEHLNRLELDGDRVINEERLLEGREWRVRSIEQGPEGLLYLGIDGGMVVRLVPRVTETG